MNNKIQNILITIVLFSLIACPSPSEIEPCTIFVKTFGGNSSDMGYSVQQTTEGGYIIIGSTYSFGDGVDNVWLIKTDDSGVEEWNRTLGGLAGSSVQQTVDGGYIITGFTGLEYGPYDVLSIKTDSNGNEEWNRTFSGDSDDVGNCVQQTNDGGYVITGSTSSFGNGLLDIWLIKTNENGDEEWNQVFGGTSSDWGKSVQQTTDGGYIITGYTQSYGNGVRDVWLIKTDENGEEEWNQTFGGTSIDEGYSVQETFDGGYVIIGCTFSNRSGNANVWLIKTNTFGQEEWNKEFGGDSDVEGRSVQQTLDSGYIITGFERIAEDRHVELLLIKTDSNGNEEWSHNYGGADSKIGYSVQETDDGGYIIAGSILPNESGSYDVLLIKTDSEGNTIAVTE